MTRRSGVNIEGNCPFKGGFGERKRPPEPGCRSAKALGVLAGSQSSLFEAESSRLGKAGALWETAFPLLHPLPSPRSTPSLGYRGEPCFRLLPAFGKSREDRFLPASPSRVSHGPCALTRRAGSCLRALTPRAFAVPRVSGGRASGNSQQKRELPALGLGASRRSVEGVRRDELRKVTSGRKTPGRFLRRCKQCPAPNAPKVQGAVRPEDRHPLPAIRLAA